MFIQEKRFSMLTNFIILITLFIYNNVTIVEASGIENDDLDVKYITAVYKSILFNEVEDFNDTERMKVAQKEIASFFYKKFCWSILTNFEHMEEETDEFRSHFQKIQGEYQILSERNLKLDEKICKFYKMFVRIIFDNVLEKSEYWKQYLRFRTRHFFWLDNQWKIKTEEFLQNMYWKLKEQSMEMECENLKEYLAKNSQNYVANYWSLEWLLDNSLDFQEIVKKQSDEKFMEMKRRIFILTGHIHFDRLELARMDILKIESPIFEFTQICLKRYLIGMEDSRRYQLRMSISFLLNSFFQFRLNMSENGKRSVGKIISEFRESNVVKFDQIVDKINGMLNSIAEMNDMNFGQEEAIMEQTLCILFKLISVDHLIPIFKSTLLFEMNVDELFNNTNLDIEMLEKKREQILAPFYFKEIEEQLEKADKDMQIILKNRTGSILRLTSLIGGTTNLRRIWEKYKEKIRSIDFFIIDFDKRTRIDYEIIFTDDNEKSQLLSRTNLNIFLLMNTIEKMLNKNKNFAPLMEDWRRMFRLKYDVLHVRPDLLAKINIEVTYQGNIILEFVEKWANKKSSTQKILADEFNKINDRVCKEVFALFDKLKNIKKEKMGKNEEFDEFEWLKNQNASSLSSHFQNIHIEQLAKLAEEDLHKKTNDNEAKIFDFWLYFQKLSTSPDKRIISRLRILLSDEGILKLVKKIFGKYSKVTKIEEQQFTGKKSTKGKKKKKTAMGQPAQEEDLQSGVIIESMNKGKVSSSQESQLEKDLNVQQNSPKAQQILDNVISAFGADKSHSYIVMGGNPIVANSQSSSAYMLSPIVNISTENALTQANLESVLNASEELRMDIIDAYLEILTRGNAKNFGLIPSYAIHSFRTEEQFPPEWLQNIKKQGIVDNVKYWLIPAHLNVDHWVLTVMDVHEMRLHYFDSFSPGSTNQQFSIDIFLIFHMLYAQCGHQTLSEQFFFYQNNPKTSSRNDLPVQENAIDSGVFMLIFAWDIIEQNSLNAKMHITQSGIKEARKQIYRQLAYGFGIEIDENMLENLNFLPSSPELTPPTSPAKSISTSLKKDSQNEAEQTTSNILPHSKLERLRSIHVIPKEEPNDNELNALKNMYYGEIFAKDFNASNFNKSSGVDIALFHFSNLAYSILSELKKRNMAKADEIFYKEIDVIYNEFAELLMLGSKNIDELACIYFKFFMRLRMNIILANNEEWKNYIHFRMRHFYWIDPNWDENAKLLMTNIIMEQINNCTKKEIKQFSKNVATIRPYSNISHWWTLKWMLQNSPDFIEFVDNYKGRELLIIKRNIFNLIGEKGFEKLEMAIPALKFNACINEMAQINLTRCFSGGLEGTKYEFRHSLSYLLNLFLQFRANCKDLGIHEEKTIKLNIEKMDKIYNQIVGVKLVKLIDEEYTLEEEVNELKESLCILLKFFDNAEEVSSEKVFSINYEQAMQCTVNEFETTLERQRFLLQSKNNKLIGNHLSAGDKDLENILKYKEGALYRLTELIGYDNFLELWNKYRENIRDKKYFTNTLNQIRQSFEMFMNTKIEHIRRLNRTKLKIYILMRWLEYTLQSNKIFAKFFSAWHKMFRLDLDELIIEPTNLKNIEIECTIRGEKIIEFVQKWIRNGRDEKQIREDYKTVQDAFNKLIAHYMDDVKENPPLQDGFQLIHLLTLKELANQDKNLSKTKIEDMEKRKEINFWQYFNELHNHPDRIARIGELLNINSLKHLYELLGIKFIESQFSQLTKLSMQDSETEEGNTLQKNLSPSGIQQQEDGLTKSAKKKLKRKNKSKTCTISTDDKQQIAIKPSESEKTIESVREIPPEKKLEEKGNLKELMGQQSHLYDGEQNTSNISLQKESGNEKSGTSPKGKTEGTSSPNGKSHKIMEESSVNKNKRKEEEEKQRESQSFEKIEKLNILNDYKFEDLMQMDTLNQHYKELMKDLNNQEKRRLTDITVFAVEIGQRLKALEISTKLWTNKMNLENIRQEVNNFAINKFKHMDELEEALYNLLKRIEFAMENPINMEKIEMNNNENIFKMRKQLHKLRLSWIIQHDSNWQNVEKEDLNNILLALNLETEKKFNEQIKIWETILGQIKLDHELAIQRGIKGRVIEVIDFAKYSQQLCFDDEQNKKEEELTEKLIEEFKFVDVKEIERGTPIKYLWMQKYMETKEWVINFVKEWHSSAEILFTGSHLLGTMISRSDMDTIVVTNDVQIHEYNQKAECIIEEIGFNAEQMKMERRRQCQNDQLFICKFCKMSRVISAVRIPGSLELVKAFICADEDYESKSFNECRYKVKVDYLFATLLKEDHLSILKRKEVKSDEIDEILVELYRLYSSRASFLALLGIRDNIRILEQFPNDGKNFRIACAALKLWAKRNNIYGPKLGFLKGVHMNLLMVKIYLRYQSASVSFLIEQFFATYIVWPWPLPVQLLQISKLTYEKSGIGSQNLLWYEKEPNAEMPIISPGFIESNKASDVDRYTKSIMRTFMSEGLKQIREIRAGKVKSTGANEWHDFMRGNDLAQRYAHYLVVNCLTKVNQGTFGDDFCAITSLKMHDFIPTDIGKLLPKEIRWYHIIEAGSRKECLINRNGYEDISKYKCDIWLVGLQLKRDKQIDPEEMIKLENAKEMNEAKEKIYNDYYEYKKRFNKTIGVEHKNSLTGNLLLSINYISVNDLHKWNINLRGWEINVKN